MSDMIQANLLSSVSYVPIYFPRAIKISVEFHRAHSAWHFLIPLYTLNSLVLSSFLRNHNQKVLISKIFRTDKIVSSDDCVPTLILTKWLLDKTWQENELVMKIWDLEQDSRQRRPSVTKICEHARSINKKIFQGEISLKTAMKRLI